ncbi:SH3 domain-containing protein [Spirulina sp.]|uniref:SH3 domain-containing protein n=1 Tax=Spirulina sp. TaxID=1157 RepID=UPI003F6E9AF1
MKRFVLSIVLCFLSTVLFTTLTKAQHRTHCVAYLIANNRDARITLRSGPSTSTRSLGYGLVNDFVYLITNSPPELDYAVDRNGYSWYRVEFPESGAKGWIRKDFLNIRCRHTHD